MSRQSRANIQARKNARKNNTSTNVQAFLTAADKGTERNRVVLHQAWNAGLIDPHTLKNDFDLDNKQITGIRKKVATRIPDETAQSIISFAKTKARELTAE